LRKGVETMSRLMDYFSALTAGHAGAAFSVGLIADLALGAKSITLTLSSGVGQVPIPDTAKIVGVCPVSSTTIRVGLEAPEADGTATGTAVASDLKKGFGVTAAVFTYFNVGTGVSRVLYLKGGASDVVEVEVT
jgi:hypothetical protein